MLAWRDLGFLAGLEKIRQMADQEYVGSFHLAPFLAEYLNIRVKGGIHDADHIFVES